MYRTVFIDIEKIPKVKIEAQKTLGSQRNLEQIE